MRQINMRRITMCQISMRISLRNSIVFGLLAACAAWAAAAPAANAPNGAVQLPLREGWALNSGCSVKEPGDVISAAGYHPSGWTNISVPSTVLAAQVASGKFKDPFFGMNLRKIPGTSYRIGENFSNLPMPADSPYACSWWYRKTFTVPAAAKGKTLWLRFGGINYRANIWVNGKQVAAAKDVAGAYRTYEFNVTPNLAAGGENVIAVETFAPTEHDLGINWVDWNPCPPDKDMGLTGPVDLVTSGPLSVRSPLVTTHFPDASLDNAELTVYGEVRNASEHPVHGVVTASLLGVRVTQAVDLAPGESKTVVFTPVSYPQLRVRHPQPWWPYQMGNPHLESLTLTAAAGKVPSDERSVRFGIREVTSEFTDKGFRLFRINGKPLLIRGGGWSQDMLLREDPEHLAQQFELTRDMHLNTIRLEGKLETDDFYRLADEQGILVMAGWCCCDQWEHWNQWTPDNYAVAEASLRSQMLRIRHHASLLVWLNGSDNPPPERVEQMYLGVEADTHWPNPTLSSASQKPAEFSGKSGVKMTGPYDFVAPSYWLVDTGRYGGAYGFNTETGPGPAIPTIYSLRKFLPADQMWPRGDDWNYHNGSESFAKLTVFDTAMNATYGEPHSLEQYERTAQAMAYDGERAMFEAYGRNKYTSTGVIQWMLNNAWPSMIWHLYDYYLDAGGGYFGVRKACEPLHVQYSYDDHSIVVVNSEYKATPGLRVQAAVYDLQLKKVFSREASLDAPADSSNRAFVVPADIFTANAQLHFVQLALLDAAGKRISENFYWVPAKLSEFDWSKTDFTHTPASSYEDLTALASLPAAKVAAEIVSSPKGAGEVQVRVHNTSQALAFQLSLRALNNNGQALEPVFWSDNYIALMPGESRLLTARLSSHTPGTFASVVVSGWNTPPMTLHLHGANAATQPAGLQ